MNSNNNNQKGTSCPLNSISSKNNPSSNNISSRDDLPSWTKFYLKSFAKGVKYCASVIMDHYLIVLVQDGTDKPEDRRKKRNGYSEGEDPASLLAFDLLDHSVQEAKIDVDLFAFEYEYSFTKYDENQILKYTNSYHFPESFVCITVESFKPFQVRCEKMNPNAKRFVDHVAQIYKDCLYVYGRVSARENELWSFDLKNETWRLCETSGEGPKPPEYRKSLVFEPPAYRKSLAFQDSLVLYGERRDQADLFLLDFNSMKWMKVKQQESYLHCLDIYNYRRHEGVLYKDHLVTLKDRLGRKENTLCCLNLHTKNTWSTFDIKGLDESESVDKSCLMVYNGSLLAFAVKNSFKDLTLFGMNLENFEICAPKSAEDEEISSLFMSQTDSDIAFKIEEKVIPAHKRVLIKKSRYFENVFESGMAESKQDVIEIKDCGYGVFKEYLQFIYQDKVNFGDVNRAIKLYTLADEFLQLDLEKKCLNYFTYNINIENVCTILDFAHQKNIPHIANWCLRFFEDNLSIKNIVGLLNNIDSQEDPDFKENNKELIEKACSFIIKKFPTKMKLSQNIKMDEINSFKESAFRFVQENIEIIMSSKIAKDFPVGFFIEFTLYQARNPYQKKGSNKKRMEPSQDEENPELKKPKK